MCGIAAILRSRAAPEWSESHRARMDCTLAHLSRRGPDGRDTHATPHALLGHTRLSIQDLSVSAAQPMSISDGANGGSLTLIYNGEIYNAPALRAELRSLSRTFRTHSDTEVLLHAIDCWGHVEALSRIRGMFSFAAIRETNNGFHLIAAVDPAGMKPLVWSLIDDPENRGEKLLVIASDCDALRLLSHASGAIDIDAIRQMLSIGYIPAPHTAWTNIHKQMPGTMLVWSGGACNPPTLTSYWQPPSESNPAHDDAAFVPLLEQLVTEHLIGDVPVGMFLSAGLDSTSIALALHNSGADMSRIQACTLSDGDPSDESSDAAVIARTLGMPHRIIPFGTGDLLPTLRAAARRYDEPQGYTALLTATRIADAMRHAAPDAKVVLAGDGGDESLGGYAWHRDAATHPLALANFQPPSREIIATHAQLAVSVARADAIDRDRQAAMVALGTLSFTHRYLARTFGGFHPAEADALIAPDIGASNFASFASPLASHDRPAMPMPRRAQRLDILGFCAGSIQPKLDRACMGVGLELRAPYLDRRVIEWGLARPVDPSELAPGGGKPSIRAYLARAIERDILPRHILDRPKQGFSLRLRDQAFESLRDVIAESRLVRDGVLAPTWSSYLTAQPDMRRTRLFTLAMLAAWYEVRV